MRISNKQMESVLANAEVFISIDIETTGFSPDKGAEIIEIGAVEICTKTRKIKRVFSEFVKPYGKIPAKITELTSITNDMVKDARRAECVLKDFREFLGDKPLVFHNADFDWDRFLERGFKKNGQVLTNPIIDTKPLTTVCVPVLKKKSLEAVCLHFGHTIQNHHRAIDDAKVTASVAIKYRNILLDRTGAPELTLLPKINVNILPVLKISKVQCWTKSEKLKRIYTLTTWGSLYYDLIKRNWFVQNSIIESSIDFNIVEKSVLRYIGENSITDLDSYFEKKISHSA